MHMAIWFPHLKNKRFPATVERAFLSHFMLSWSGSAGSLQSQASQKEVIILGGLLMLCWSGLRFSDLQRSHLASWQLDPTSLRGLTWRAKTCSTATPFGILLSGLLSQGSWTWTLKFLKTLDEIYANQEASQIDFAIPAFHNQIEPITPFEAMTYAEALYYLRYYMTLPWSHHHATLQVDASSYSVNSSKQQRCPGQPSQPPWGG